jgi:hypothetical protein
MNQHVTGTDLAIPDQANLATMFKAEDGMDDLIAKIEATVREQSEGLDPAVKKDREAMKSLAYKVSQTKAELDRQGLALTEEARKQIGAINAGRKSATERLDALRDRTKKPALDWEKADEERLEKLKANMSVFDLDRVSALSTTEEITQALQEVTDCTVGEEWDEYQPAAEAARDKAIAKFSAELQLAKVREEEQAELARLRAEAEARRKQDEEAEKKRAAEEAEARRVAEEAERQKREAEEAEERRRADIKLRAEQRITALKELAEGRINGRPEAVGVLQYELRELSKIPDDLREFSDEIQPEIDRAEMAMDHIAAEARRREEERQAAARREAEEAARRKADEEEARKRAEEEARAADTAHREKIRDEIAAGIAEHLDAEIALSVGQTIAAAILAGKIPHVKGVL